MRKILKSRLLRCVICLLLIGCFLLNSSPLRAKALEPVTTTVATTVAVAVAVAAAFQVLGVMSGSDPVSFNDAVNNCVTYLTNSTSFVVNGMVQVLGVSSDSLVRSFLMKDFIQACWEWLFSSGTVKQSVMAYSSSATFRGTTYSVSADFPFGLIAVWFQGTTSSSFGAIYAYSERVVSGSLTVNGKTVSVAGTTDIRNYYRVYGVKSSSFYSDAPVTSVRLIKVGSSDIEQFKYRLDEVLGTAVYSDLDLTFGQITGPFDGTGARKLEETEEYQGYGTKIIEFPSSDPNNPGGESDLDKVLPWLPAGIPSPEYDDSTTTQTQEDAQSGETGLEFDFDTETDPDSGLDPDPDPDPGTNSGSSSWTPPSDYTQFQLIDLKNFFPFCIPFDLFHFFELLYAEPIAPVLHWEMADLAGKTYSITIDLSEWDSVAQLFRRLQLFLFVCGLAAASRKFIKW